MPQAPIARGRVADVMESSEAKRVSDAYHSRFDQVNARLSRFAVMRCTRLSVPCGRE